MAADIPPSITCLETRVSLLNYHRCGIGRMCAHALRGFSVRTPSGTSFKLRSNWKVRQTSGGSTRSPQDGRPRADLCNSTRMLPRTAPCYAPKDLKRTLCQLTLPFSWETQ